MPRAAGPRSLRRQAGRWAAQEQQQYAQEPQYAPPPQYAAPAPPPQDDADDMIAQLAKLGHLRDKGILTDAEFAEQKARLLSG